MLRDVLETLLLTLLIFLIVRAMVQNFKVEGRSMEPTLHDSQYLLINKATYWRVGGTIADILRPGSPRTDRGEVYVFGPPERGDIVVLRYPREPDRDFIKRVIAVPGDVVEVRDGGVIVNGQTLEERYLAAEPNYSLAPQQVSSGNYFVLGDNRNYSSDSHVWGVVPEQNILGKAWLSYWPLDQWGLVPSVALAVQLQGDR